MGIAPRDLLWRKGTSYEARGLDRCDAVGVKLCRPSDAVLDILPSPQRGVSKEDGEVVIDAAGQDKSALSSLMHAVAETFM
jgi:arsenate reductase